ncbi:MAG: transposase [Bacillota bacterium]|nr:transposase [Bacillota bacterium]
MLEDEVVAYAREKGKHSENRTAYRHGYEGSSVVLGGQKVQVEKPRVRSKSEDKELPIITLIHFQEEGLLNDTVLKRIINGISTRKYKNTFDDVIEKGRSVSKSTVSRKFTKITEKLMNDFLNRPIEDDFPIMMMDGAHLCEYLVVVVLGITKEGKKKILGLIEGSTENSKICSDLLQSIIDRGLDTNEERLFVLDGKGLHKAVKDVFGDKVHKQRCQIHKQRNVQKYLPESKQKAIKTAMYKAYIEFDYDEEKKKLILISRELEFKYPMVYQKQ